MSLCKFVRENFEPRQLPASLLRMDGSLGHDPALLGIESHSAKGIGHHVTLDRFGRMARPPAYDVAAESRLAKNVPKRFAFARCARVRPCTAIHRVRLDETVDAVLIGKLACSYRVP